MQFRLPEKFRGAEIFSSEISDGLMNFASSTGRKNLAKFLKKIAAKNFASGSQPHEIRIEVAEKAGRVEDTDGVFTQADLALGVKSADCIPLMIFEPKTKTLGAVHVSRKNLIGEIISRSLAEEIAELKIEPRNLAIFLGPHIKVENYEVKDNVIEALVGTRWEQFLERSGGKTFFDLTEATVAELEAIGMTRDNIVDCGINTYTDKRFFSARGQKEETPSVFVTVIKRS